ncbi:hypothetical protein [Streptomyces mirabilis]|uniref:hypothetical protein n=1 Tax=Streptomyces mirabilis TaxID=68239 RepID=UPI00364CA8CE
MRERGRRPCFTFNRRKKLLTIAGVAAGYGVVGFYAGMGLGYIPDKPAAVVVAFLLTTAVATAASGLAPFVRQFFLAVAVGLFIVMSIPTAAAPRPCRCCRRSSRTCTG